MITSPGTMKQRPPRRAPRRPRSRQAQKMASCVEAGPGSRLVAEMPSSNSWALSHRRSSTQSFRNSAMWAGGPPNPMTPMRLHSRTMVESGTLCSTDSVMVGVEFARTVTGGGDNRKARPVSLGDSSRCPAQASIAARSWARRSRLSEYQTHLPRRSPWTSPASLRIFM